MKIKVIYLIYAIIKALIKISRNLIKRRYKKFEKLLIIDI